MSDKGKARKLEDRKSVRGQPPANLQSLGGGPGMVHHHNYGIPSEGFHSGSHIAYRPGLTQLMNQMGGPSRAHVNDLGPPIFMPSLNLGTPKLPTGGGSNNMAAASSSLPNSRLKSPQHSMNSSVGFDMMSYTQGSSLSAFHSASPLKPVQYISSSPISKPTPISMAPHAKGATVTKVGGQEVMSSPQPAFTSAALPKTSSSSQGVVKILASSESGCVKGEGLHPYGYHPPAVSSNISKTSSHQQIISVSSPGTNPPGGNNYPTSSLFTDPYSVQSTAMVPIAPPTPATSGQPSSISSFPDTRLDRPPHPSAPHTLPIPPPPLSGGPTPGSLTISKESKDRLTTAEVASNIIISNPGLTGKHIAAMTNTTQQLPSILPHSSYSSPISHSTLSSGVHGCINSQQQHLVDTGWGGYTPQQQQHNSNHIFHTSLSPPLSMAAGGGANPNILNQQSNGRVLKSTSNIPHSPLGGGGGGQTLPPDAGMMSPPNSSPRPRILRGKRSLDGNWKLDGQANSLHSPGSPHRSKLQRSLKNSTMCSPGGSGGGGDDGGGGDGSGGDPTSPTFPLNHVGISTKIEGGDISGSPRKKPRKQNVVANDDQYASNVPDTHRQAEDVGGLSHGTAAEEPPVIVNHSKGPHLHGKPMSPTPKHLEICYLSQLRKCPYLINGVYKLHHHTAHNHFRRYADIKHRDELPLSVYDLANNRLSQHRASGWKLYHFSSQLEEMAGVENDVLIFMERIKDTITNMSSCLLDRDALSSTQDLIQGNIDHSSRIKSHVESTRTNMFTVLNQKSQVMDILDKYSNFKSDYSSISPSLSSSSSSHHKSQS